MVRIAVRRLKSKSWLAQKGSIRRGCSVRKCSEIVLPLSHDGPVLAPAIVRPSDASSATDPTASASDADRQTRLTRAYLSLTPGFGAY